MMKTQNYLSVIIITIALSFFGLAQAIAQTPEWMSATGSEGDDYQSLWDMQTDPDGNVIVTGEHRVSAFDIGGVTIDLTGTIITNGYAAKIAPNGEAIWTKALGGAGLTGCIATAVQSDSQGNTYLGGYFLGFAGLPLVVDGITLPAEGGFTQCFLLKLDEDGTVVWGKTLNDPAAMNSFHRIINIEVDSDDNAIINGNYNVTMKFDEITIESIGSDDNFLAKCDADGNFLWARSIGGIDQDKRGELAINSENEIFASGVWAGDTLRSGDLYVVNDNPLVGDNFDRWIGKFDADGNPIWLNREGGPTDEWGSALAANQTGGVMVLSRAIGEITINEVSFENVAALATSYNFEGGVAEATSLMNAELLETVAYDELYPAQIEADGLGNFYICQTYLSEHCEVGDIVLDNFSGNAGTADVTVAKINDAGEVLWAVNAGDQDSEYGFRLALGNNGNVFLGGEYRSFELEFGETTLQNFGSPEQSIFAATLDITTGLNPLKIAEMITVYPNPADDFICFNTDQVGTENTVVRFFDINGRLVLEERRKLLENNRIDISSLENGVYLMEFTSEGTKYTGKIIKN